VKVAVVRNHDRTGVVNAFGRPSPERYSERTVLRVADALALGGHEVVILEADCTLLAALHRELPAVDPTDPAHPAAMVFNLAYGIQGECRYTQLPALLEMAGVPYTGSGPLGHTLSLDKVITKALIAAGGVATPGYLVMASPEQDLAGLRYPLVVKPRQESTSYGLALAEDESQVRAAAAAVIRRYRQPALLEEYVEGREVCIALVGNGSQLRCLPPVEIDFGDRTGRLLTKADKFHRSQQEAQRVCPARIDDDLRRQLEATARAVFRACHCHDYARVDIRIDANGVPWVLEINSMASLGTGGSFILAAEAAGYDFDAAVNLLLDTARTRYVTDTFSECGPNQRRLAAAAT
jgi:D-alanine-D-alanine ligase